MIAKNTTIEIGMSESVQVKILIVDDREENLFAMEALLESPDLFIITARSGNEALGILLEQEVALILLDVQMPGMNGFETAELIRGSSRTKHIPIIFVTAISKEKKNIFQGYESGAVDYLFKPIEPEILKSKVRVFIDLHQQKQTLENITRKLEMTISELIDSRKKLRHNEESIREAWQAAEKARDSAEEASRAKSEFLANMSHEIRTPLNGIIGMADLALLETINPQQKERIESIRQSGESLLEILNEILDLSKIEAERVELESISFNPMEVIERVARMLSIKIYEKDLELICKIDPNIPDQVIGDPTRFRQVILNLLSNAYKFTEKGEIHFEAKFRSASLQKVIIDFKISDTGIGIAGDKLDNIFQSFEQAESSTSRKYGGTGLGLSITRKLLDLMKGEIRVTSVLGKGSTFYMSIPFNKYSETGPISEEAEDKTGSFSPVLIIDKSSNSSEAIRAVFDSLPVAYKILINPVVDVDELANSLTNEKLIIIDSEIITTEEKLLTDELPRALNSTKNIPVIVMAPSTVNLNKDDLIARGLYSILRKPLFPRDVKATLNEPLELRQDNALLNQQDIIGIGGGRSLHLLLAEDNPINTKLAVGLIQLKNWKVDCAVNGMEAVEMFKLKSYDLVLMDIQMPEMDGMDATRKIREIEAMKGSKHTPIVALSAHAMKNDIDKALSCGMDDYITKPFKPKELYIIIDKLTQRNIEN